MRKLFSKTTLAAGFALALAFTFSACGDHSIDDLLEGNSSSSVGGSQQTYNYCITAYGCLPGPFTASDCNGQVTNSCPNSGDVVSSSSIIVSSSSVTVKPSSSSNQVTPTTNLLDGVWTNNTNTIVVAVSGNSGIFSSYTGTSATWLDAINKGYVKIGTSQIWRNLTSTGNLTWSGQSLQVTYNTSSPNVAVGTAWTTVTITMSADGQTITATYANGDTSTYTRGGNYSLDGVWTNNTNTIVVTVSGNNGIFSSYTGTSAVWLDAINKGYVKIGTSQMWRNLTSTGNLTWSGQALQVTYNTSSPNIAVGTAWTTVTITMSADGQTITATYANGDTYTFTRQ